MQKKWIFLTGILLLVLAAAWLYYLYQQPRKNVVGKNADYVITAVDLYNEFKEDEERATAKFADKILVVNGTVKEIIESGDYLTIQLGTGNENGDVNAGMNEKSKDIKIVTGDKVSIKGRCTGFLTDVYMSDCIIENKKQ